MDAPASNPADSSVADLVGRLREDGRRFVRAEIGLYRQIARHRAGKARNGIIAIVAAALLLNAAIVVLLIGLALGLAVHIGPVAGALVVVAATAGIGYLLIRWGAGKLGALSGDEEEREALAAGERMT